MWSPQQGVEDGRTPGRQNVAAVRQSLHQSFRSLVASPSGEAKAPVPDHEDNWEAKGSRMALQLEDLQKSLEVKIHEIKVNRMGAATPNVMPAQDSSSAIRSEIDALLEKFGEEYGKEDGESIDDVIDAITAIITQRAQLVITEKLYNEIGDWHADKVNHMQGLHKSMLHDVRSDLQRVGGVVTQHGGGLTLEDEQSRQAIEQFDMDSFKINGANHDVTLAEEDLDGMKEIKEKLARSRGGRQKWKQGASLSAEDIGRLTAKNESEELLDKRIKEQEEAINRAKVARGQVALDILGGGTSNLMDTKPVLTAVKKLAAAKIDMAKGADTKKAALIRTLSMATVKENYMRLWKLAPVIRLLGSNHLIGKDFYCLKNNDVTRQEDEAQDEWLKRLSIKGFKAVPIDWRSAGHRADTKEGKGPAREGKPDEGTPDGGKTTSIFVDDEEELVPLDGRVDIVTEDDLMQISEQLTDFITANGEFFDLLNGEMPDQITAACDKSGTLFGETMHDSRINSAAHGDGLSNIEAWIFGAERFGDKAHEAAADFLKNAAGWLVQDNWKGGIATLRAGIQTAVDLRVEVTWSQTIAKYMGQLLQDRPIIALQMKDEYGHPPKDKNSNVIMDITYFLGKLTMLMQNATGDERSLKKDKESRRNRAHAVSRSQIHAYLVVEPVVADWDTVDKEYLPTAMYTDGGDGGKGKGKKGKDRGKTAKAADSKEWKMWKHSCQTFDSEHRRCCDNQGCENKLTQEQYKSVCRRQKLKDERSAKNGYARLPVWHQCEECHATSDEDDKLIMPDGYKPKSNTTDSSRATKEWIKVTKGRTDRIANAAIADADDDDLDDAASMISMQSVAESAKDDQISQQAEQIRSLEQGAKDKADSDQAARFKKLEDKFEKMIGYMDEQRDDETESKKMKVRGRGNNMYSSLRMDADDEER